MDNATTPQNTMTEHTTGMRYFDSVTEIKHFYSDCQEKQPKQRG